MTKRYQANINPADAHKLAALLESLYSNTNSFKTYDDELHNMYFDDMEVIISARTGLVTTYVHDEDFDVRLDDTPAPRSCSMPHTFAVPYGNQHGHVDARGRVYTLPSELKDIEINF